MRILGNIIWLIFGGLISFICYIVGGIALCVTIVGIPFGVQVFKLAEMTLWPFNKRFQLKEGQPGCLSTLMNIIWIVFAGFWLAIVHLVFGVLLCITIIGIPWGKQHFKMMSLAFAPFGVKIVNI